MVGLIFKKSCEFLIEKFPDEKVDESKLFDEFMYGQNFVSIENIQDWNEKKKR